MDKKMEIHKLCQINSDKWASVFGSFLVIELLLYLQIPKSWEQPQMPCFHSPPMMIFSWKKSEDIFGNILCSMWYDMSLELYYVIMLSNVGQGAAIASAGVGGGAQCPKWRNIAKKLRFFSKPNWVARINIWIMPVQNLALLSYFGTSKLPISGPNLGCLRQNFSFDFTVVILLSKFLEKPNKVRA